MIDFLTYDTISKVLSSWELARQRIRHNKPDEEIGTRILYRMFEIDPNTKQVFGFDPKADVKGNELLKMGVLVHGLRMVQMLDSALMLLGPDASIIQELLGRLGQRHSKFGVQVSYFDVLGRALRDVLSEILGKEIWKEGVDCAWIDVYEGLSNEIIKSMVTGRLAI